MEIRRWLRHPALGFVLLAAAYMLADLILNKVAIGVGWTILWPLNGVTIALLLRTPRRRWLRLLLVIELGTMLGERLGHNPLLRELLERTWSTIEVVLSALLLPAFASMEDWLAQPKLVRRICGALVLGPGLTGMLYAVHMHLQSHTPLLAGWTWWGPPDMLGNAVTMPVALACFAPEMWELLSLKRCSRTVLLLIGSTLLTVLIFSEGTYPLLFLYYPMLLYVDWKLSFAGASVALFLSSVLGVFCTVHGLGPFGHWPGALLLPAGVALQIYLGFHAVALLPLSLMMMERKNIGSQLREANAQLQALARQDPLTGIANRRAFDEALAVAWEHAETHRMPLSMLMLDIDHFKQFNDSNGHLLGDACLVRVAQLLGATMGENNRVARFGGEEFVVLLPEGGVQACFQMAERLRREVVCAAIPHDDSPWGIVTISIGCATVLPAMGGERHMLLAEADAALYRAKERGRNQLASPLTGDGDLRRAQDEETRRETASTGSSVLDRMLLPATA